MLLPLTVLNLAGAVALLLWGVRMVQTGVQRAFGARLRTLLAGALRSRGRAFLAGLVATAILQSSTATGLMITGFAADGLVALVPGLAVMLGANVGTTLIVQLLSFDVSSVSPALILLGVLAFQRGTAGTRDAGRIAIGLGLMLLSLRQLLDVVTPFEDVPSLRLLLGAVATEPLLDLVLAAGLAWAAHSSVAIVLLVMSLAAKGVIPPQAAFALVLGANLGTALNPLLEGGAGGDRVAMRLPLGNLLARLVGGVATLAALPLIGPVMVMLEPDNARAVADFHTAFNLVLAVLLLPVLPGCAAVLQRLLPVRIVQDDPLRPHYLDPAAQEMPSIALGHAAREALRLADILDAMLEALHDALERGDRRRIEEARQLDDILDSLNTAIRLYLTRLEPAAMSDADHQRADAVLAFATNMEFAGDVVGRNLLGLAARRARQGLPGAEAEWLGLGVIVERLRTNLRMAGSLLMTTDPRIARQLVTEKEAFRGLEARATAAYLSRMRDSTEKEAGAAHLDALRDLKRVNAHLVAAAAYPVLERSGELLPSRLRMPGDIADDE